MSYEPKKQVIVEAKNLTGSAWNYGSIGYIFEPAGNGNNHWHTGGTFTITDYVGLVQVGGYYALPIGTYDVNTEAVIEVSATGHGDTFTFGNITGTSPSLAYNQLNSNATIVRSFSEYSLGSKDYVSTSLQFELEITNPQGILQAMYANVIEDVPYMKLVFTKIN